MTKNTIFSFLQACEATVIKTAQIMERSDYRSIGSFYLIPRNYQPILSENRNIAYSGS